MRGFIIVLFAAVFIAGCEFDIYQSNENLPRLRAEWEREYAAWKSLGIQNYECIIDLGDTGIIQKITVKDNVCQSAVYVVPEGDDEPSTQIFYETIDEIFDRIDEEFTRDENRIFSPGQIGTYFSVRYDPEYHYPAQYDSIDKYKKGNVDGNGLAIWVYEFTPLEYGTLQSW
jgi:hypothetical protein